MVRSVSGRFPLWVYGDVIATLNSNIVSSCFSVLAFATAHPKPASLPLTPLYYTLANIKEFHEKSCQKLAKISHYLLARLIVQKLIDN